MVLQTIDTGIAILESEIIESDAVCLQVDAESGIGMNRVAADRYTRRRAGHFNAIRTAIGDGVAFASASTADLVSVRRRVEDTVACIGGRREYRPPALQSGCLV